MIQPGLERIAQLLKNVELPWKAIHVAGTNGKGSVCTYAHQMLVHHGIQTARFTSPHLVDRWDCIRINNTVVSEEKFKKVERHFIKLNERLNIQASEFELLTATAFQLFNDYNVEVGVVEVGMGGKLDATNILNNQCVSVITKIAFDHQNFLGNTLEEISRHKAGVLRPGVPYVVNPANEFNVQLVIDEIAREVGAGPRLHVDKELRQDVLFEKEWANVIRPLRKFQEENTALAFLAVRETIAALGSSTFSLMHQVLPSLKTTQNPGRLQRLAVPIVFGSGAPKILIDGAHNQDAARVLREYVDTQVRIKPLKGEDEILPPPSPHWPVTWVMAMTEGKDPLNVIGTLVRPGDNMILTTFGPVDGMPWVKPMDPYRVRRIALEAVPNITGLVVPERSPHRALMAAKYLTLSKRTPIVMAGSLYLMGDFWREKMALDTSKAKLDFGLSEIGLFETQEQRRVTRVLQLHEQESTALLCSEDYEAKLKEIDEEVMNIGS